MQQKIGKQVEVAVTYKGTEIVPVKLRWDKKEYRLIKLGLVYPVREGITKHWFFSVSTDTLCFLLDHNTSDLSWTLVEVSDGLVDVLVHPHMALRS